MLFIKDSVYRIWGINSMFALWFRMTYLSYIFRKFPKGRMRQNFERGILLLLWGALLFSGFGCDGPGSSRAQGRIVPLQDNWERAVEQQTIPKGLRSISAKSCGRCHVRQYEEWQYSTHSHAWTDAQFQAELKKESSPFMCINCHIPLQNQQDSIVKGLVDGDIYRPVKEGNPGFDRSLQVEGVTCAVCHVRDGKIIGLTGTEAAPHPVVLDSAFLSERLCISCHNAVAVVTPTLACTFETGDEWKAGPYYGRKTCIDCHMDTLSRPLVPNYPVHLSHHHYFRGSGIPKSKGAKTKVFNGLDFALSIEPGDSIDSDSVRFSFVVTNAHAGHRVPTGDPERFFALHFEVRDNRGEEVFRRVDRIGEQWEWYPKARKLSDNNLYPGEKRRYSYAVPMPGKRPFVAHIWVEKHRLSEEAANYNHLGEAYPRFITVYDTTFMLPVMR